MPLDQTAIVCVSRLRRHERERERAVVRPTRFELARTNPVGLESTPLDHSGTVAVLCPTVAGRLCPLPPPVSLGGKMACCVGPDAPQCEILNH